MISESTNKRAARSQQQMHTVNSTTSKTTCSNLRLEDALIATALAVVVVCIVAASCHLTNEHAACRNAMSENENGN